MKEQNPGDYNDCFYRVYYKGQFKNAWAIVMLTRLLTL